MIGTRRVEVDVLRPLCASRQTGRPVIESLVRSNAPNANGTAYLENDPVTGQPIILRAATGTRSLYITDANNNPVALLNNSGQTAVAYQYDPYGADTITAQDGFNASRQNPYLFATGIQDRTTGWVKYGQRFYDPTTGRWTQQDTIDTPLDPANANRYAYAAGDPVNNLDPTGREITLEGTLTALVIGIAGSLFCATLAVGIGLVTAVVGGIVFAVVCGTVLALGFYFALEG